MINLAGETFRSISDFETPTGPEARVPSRRVFCVAAAFLLLAPLLALKLTAVNYLSELLTLSWLGGEEAGQPVGKLPIYEDGMWGGVSDGWTPCCSDGAVVTPLNARDPSTLIMSGAGFVGAAAPEPRRRTMGEAESYDGAVRLGDPWTLNDAPPVIQ